MPRHRFSFQLPTTERGWAEYWGHEALSAIRLAVESPQWTTVEDLHLQHAVRSTRMAVWHALKVLGKERGK